MRHSLLVVAKRPAPGYAKTRLCPPLTGEQAAALYECFLLDTLELMRQTPGVECAIAYLADGEAQADEARCYFRALAPDMPVIPQRGNDLGERLHHLLSDALATGSRAAVVMDSDSPTLPLAYLEQAFRMLDGPDDVVLGPCDDGGYYLVGMKQPHRRLLCDVQMSTPTVLADTLAIATQLGLRVGLLPIWYDVDTSAELDRLRLELALSEALIAPHTRDYLSALDATDERTVALARVADHPRAE